MNNFRKPHGSRPGSRPGFGAPARPRSSGARQEVSKKFDAVCSKCGKACQVPFRPSGTRPVYCKNCFGAPQQALSNTRNSSANEGKGKSIADLTRQIGAINAKIDSILKIFEELRP